MPVNIHANASHAFDGHVAERKAIRRLEDALFVSFATNHDSYLYALAKPTDSARERFNFDRELLAIFTPFSRSDMRTINTLKQLRRSHRDRIHPTVSLVFHKCEGKHRESLERLCRDEFENDLILVPLSILDLTQTDDPMGYLIRAFRRTIGESKIFERSSPLTSGRFFYGRSEMVRRIADGTYQQQKHYGVFGVRKSGKTSVLYAIQRSLNDQVVSSYIDCENPDICTGDWKSALGILFERLSASADIKPTRSFNVGRPTESLRLLVNEILDDPSVVHVSVLLDEIEHITPLSLTKPWTTDFVLFWRALRSISQEVKNRLTFIVAGVNAGSVSIPHIRGEPSPLYELLNEEFLPPFTETDITEMLEDLGGLLAIRFEQGVASQLKDQYGGHPLATRIACSEVLRSTQQRADRMVDGSSMLASTIEAQHFEVLSDEITGRLEWVAREILVSLALWYEDEYDILHSLALNLRTRRHSRSSPVVQRWRAT